MKKTCENCNYRWDIDCIDCLGEDNWKPILDDSYRHRVHRGSNSEDIPDNANINKLDIEEYQNDKYKDE